MSLFPLTRSEVVAELKREVRMRERVYGRLVGAGKMRPEHAEHQIACLKVAIKRLETGPDFEDKP